ncbi:FHA domain-containing protein [Naasia aerilata]|uniref:FHA domain-containing protein n=1 Tax=Naasia aerilata TaxID=1162966 RepID=A0ABN6XVL5_9MICO|nr:FHA domain-containing protein [Naasia aerilata]BDZ47408.1 hypothetical protein GCM10025866_33170 [Naasia aerilata]
MSATPLTLDEGTEVRPVALLSQHSQMSQHALAPEHQDALPSRRRKRETAPSRGAEDRISALSALDSAVEYVLVVREGDRLRVFSEGGLAAQDEEGRELHPSVDGELVVGTLPLLIGRSEDGELPPASALDTSVPAAPVEAAVAEEDAESLLESLLELGETNRVPDLVRGSLAEAPAEVEPEAEAYLSLALALPDGRRITADHTVLLGRSPSRRPLEPEAEVVALASNLTDISRNHLEIVVDGDTVLARDLTSTNGTVLTRPGQAPRLVPTDEPVRILPGDSLNLGGSATIEVEGLR